MTDCMNTSIRIRPLTSPMTKMCLLNVQGGGAGLVSISHHCFVFASPHFLSISQASTIAFKTMCMTVPHPWYQHHPCCSCLIKKMQELKFLAYINNFGTRLLPGMALAARD